MENFVSKIIILNFFEINRNKKIIGIFLIFEIFEKFKFSVNVRQVCHFTVAGLCSMKFLLVNLYSFQGSHDRYGKDRFKLD